MLQQHDFLVIKHLYFQIAKKIIVMAALSTVGVSPDSCSLCDISRPYLEEKESRIDPILELVRAAGTTFYNQTTGRKTRAEDLNIQCLLSQIEKDWDSVRKVDLSKEKDKNIDIGNKKNARTEVHDHGHINYRVSKSCT